MNEKERIIRIMNEENMNATQFSESTGIQRAAVSHILAGRNNPSLDVIKKILKRFPTINPDWLLSGEGPMRRNTQHPDDGNHIATTGAGITTDSSLAANADVKYKNKPATVSEKYDLFSQPTPRPRQVSKPETRLTGTSSSVPNQRTNTTPVQKESLYHHPADIHKEIHFTDGKLQGEEVNDAINEMKETIKETIVYKERPNKTIEKLLIFYSDNTFETFIAEKQEK
jgi:transcriptional regulator with XRE-family HTH domain